jgi:hypothetical protein
MVGAINISAIALAAIARSDFVLDMEFLISRSISPSQNADSARERKSIENFRFCNSHNWVRVEFNRPKIWDFLYARGVTSAPWQCLNLRPEPQGHAALRCTLPHVAGLFGSTGPLERNCGVACNG